ncbi:MAG: hypothetical protein IV086_16840 [Hyphomonadaceae bacterium]|nr:MAG: hypothetical protein FD160_2026 [Caulobacteraceae bacterium]MBT9447369.1 hypothetical protein [Hyphomonadaceae bacterium]TPW07449.1 MAG: hypothetical protein FD124_1132 [Alphaproteobacteria bacterium]
MRQIGRQLVVDSNALRSGSLRDFLARSRANVAVLTDYAAMEAYKGDPLVGISNSMEILGEFPAQVLVLKGTTAVCGLSGRAAGLRRRMIDGKQSTGFGEFLRDIFKAREGDQRYVKSIERLGEDARAQMEELRLIASGLGAKVDELMKAYSDEERRVLRLDAPLTQAMLSKFAASVRHTAGVFYETHPSRPKWPSIEEFANTFLFRAALCSHLMALRWAAVGGVAQKRPDRVRNDMVDVVFATYATFFDGILTEDKMLSELHAKALVVLRAIARQPR